MNLRLISFLFFLTLFLIGCQADDSPRAGETPNQMDDYFLHVENSETTNQTFETNREIADHLAELASSVPSVNEAYALVAGPYSVVAIDVEAELDRSRVGTIKYAVAEALYHDPYGKTSVVVADANVKERIQGMREKVAQGYPVHGFIDELAAIVGRNMPEFPTNDHQPIEPDQNEAILDEEEANQLEQMQEELK